MKTVLQTAGGILIAVAVIVAAHEGWAHYQWRLETIQIRDQKAAELMRIAEENPDIFARNPLKLDMSKGLESVRKITSNQ